MTPRVAVVTGGTRGLGAALSSALVARHVSVVAAYRSDTASATALRGRCGDRLYLSQVDVTQPAACRSLIERVVAEHGRIDYLVNCAGAVQEAKATDLKPEAWDASVALNLSAAFYLSQAALVPMKAQQFGRIVNVGSVSASMGSPFQIDYAAAKSGLIGLTRSMARAVARASVTVNCVILGGFTTDLLKDLTLTDRSRVEANIPLGRFGEPREFAHVVLSLLDDDASYVTGATLTVDGGLSMGD
ncbi:MAG TPA: SDR family oxidoreductase [Acidimicrobiales bacterium]|jgi:acetoacetyl-CoA reductase/3-oxoacyl-[acyl-carrier protein] reductase|nr:SDR family oxidoreductase [Acidimicrobiales bacterium]